jgi:hypothetical protein
MKSRFETMLLYYESVNELYIKARSFEEVQIPRSVKQNDSIWKPYRLRDPPGAQRKAYQKYYETTCTF